MQAYVRKRIWVFESNPRYFAWVCAGTLRMGPTYTEGTRDLLSARCVWRCWKAGTCRENAANIPINTICSRFSSFCQSWRLLYIRWALFKLKSSIWLLHFCYILPPQSWLLVLASNTFKARRWIGQSSQKLRISYWEIWLPFVYMSRQDCASRWYVGWLVVCSIHQTSRTRIESCKADPEMARIWLSVQTHAGKSSAADSSTAAIGRASTSMSFGWRRRRLKLGYFKSWSLALSTVTIGTVGCLPIQKFLLIISGNTALDQWKGEAFVFDVCSFCGCNEYDTGNWRAPRHRLSNKAYIKEYKSRFPVSSIESIFGACGFCSWRGTQNVETLPYRALSRVATSLSPSE